LECYPFKQLIANAKRSTPILIISTVQVNLEGAELSYVNVVGGVQKQVHSILKTLKGKTAPDKVTSPKKTTPATKPKSVSKTPTKPTAKK
jgi:hypothetical protein